MDLTEKPIDSRNLYRGRIVTLRLDTVELPNGAHATREVVEHCGGVCLAALTDAQELLFVRQYRYPYRRVLLELPAGKLEPGEDPLEGGKRELSEETGASAREFRSLGVMYPSVGYTDEVLYLYLATGLSVGEMHPDADEFLEIERIPLARAVEMVMAGEIEDSKTQIAVLKTARLLHIQ